MTTVNGIFMVDSTGDITPDGDPNGVGMRSGSQKSVKSRRSIGVISIFADPSAAKEMAGDTEVTYTYETTTEERMRRMNSTSSSNTTGDDQSAEFEPFANGGGHSAGGSASVNKDQRILGRSSSERRVVAWSNSDDKLKPAVSNPTVAKGRYNAASDSQRRKINDVRKVGSFQMKSSYSSSPASRTSSTSAKHDDVFRAALENSLARRAKHPETDTPQHSGATVNDGPTAVLASKALIRGRHNDSELGTTSQGTRECRDDKAGENNDTPEASVSTMHDFEKEMNEALQDMDDIVQGNYTESESNKSVDAAGTSDVYRSRGGSRNRKEQEVASAMSSNRESMTSENAMSGSYDISAPSGDNATGRLDSNQTGSVGVNGSSAQGIVEFGDVDVTPVIYRSRESISRDVSKSSSSVDIEPEPTSSRSSKRASMTSNVSVSGSYDITVDSDDNNERHAMMHNDSSRSDYMGVNRYSAQDVVQNLMMDATAKASYAESGSVKSDDGDVTPVIYRSNENIMRDVNAEPETASGTSSKRASTISVSRDPGSYHMNATSGDNIGRLALTRNGSNRSGSVGVNRSSAQDIIQNLMTDATAQASHATNGSVKSGGGDVTPVIYRSRENITRDVDRSGSSGDAEPETASGTSSMRASMLSVNRDPGSYNTNTPSGDNIAKLALTGNGRLALMRNGSNRSGSEGVNRSSAQDIVQNLMTDATAQASHAEYGYVKSGGGDVTPVIYRSVENITRDVDRSGSSGDAEPETASGTSSKRASTISVSRDPGSYHMNATSGDNIGRLALMRNGSNRSGSVGVNRSSAQDIIQNLMTDATAQASHATNGSVKSGGGDVTPVIYRSRENITRDFERSGSSVGAELEAASGPSSKRTSTTSINREAGSYHLNAPSGDNIGRLALMRNDSNRSGSVGVNRSSAQDIVQNLMTDATAQASHAEYGSVKSGGGDVTPVIYRSMENITRDVDRSGSSGDAEPETASGTSSMPASMLSVNRDPGSYNTNTPSGDNIAKLALTGNGRLALMRNGSNRSGSEGVNRSSAQDIVQNLMTDATAQASHAEYGYVKSGGGDVTPVIYRSVENITRDVDRSGSSGDAEPETASGTSSKRASTISVSRDPGSYHMNATSGDNIGRLALMRNGSNRSGSVGVNRSSAQDIIQNLMTDATAQASHATNGSVKSGGGDVTPVIYRSRENITHDFERSGSSVGAVPETASGPSSKRTSTTSINREPGSYHLNAPSGDNIGRLALMRNDSNRSGSVGVNRSSAQDIVQNLMTDATAQASHAEYGSVKSGGGDVTPVIYRSMENITRDVDRSGSSGDAEPETASGTSSMRASMLSVNRDPGSYNTNTPSGDNIAKLALTRNGSNRSGSIGVNSYSAEDIVQDFMADTRNQASYAGSTKYGDGDLPPVIYRSRESLVHDVSRNASSVSRAAETDSRTSSRRTSTTSVSRQPGSFQMNAPSGDNIGRLALGRNGSSRSGSVGLDRSSAQYVVQNLTAETTAQVTYEETGSVNSGGADVTPTPDIYRSQESITHDVSRNGSYIGRERETTIGALSKRSSAMSDHTETGSYDMTAPPGDDDRPPSMLRSNSNLSGTAGVNISSTEDIVQNFMAEVKAQASYAESSSTRSGNGDVTPDIYRSKENVTYDHRGSTSSIDRAPETASGTSSMRASMISLTREPGSFRMNAPSGENIGRPALMRNDSNRSGSVGLNASSAQDIVRSLTKGATARSSYADSGSVKSGGDDVTQGISGSMESINRDVSRGFSVVSKKQEAESDRSSMRTSMTSLNREPGLFSMDATYVDDNTGIFTVTRSDSNHSDSMNKSSAQGAHKLMTEDTKSASSSLAGSRTGLNVHVMSSMDSTHVANADGNISSATNSVAHFSQTSLSSGSSQAARRDGTSVNSAALEPSRESREPSEALPVASASSLKPVKQNRPPGQFRTNIAVAYRDITTTESNSHSAQRTNAIGRSESSGSRRSVDGSSSVRQMALTMASTQALGAESILGEPPATSPPLLKRPTTLSLSRTGSRASDVSGRNQATGDTTETMVVSPSVLQNDEFKAKLSTLMGGLTPLSPSSATSQSSSLDRRKRARTEPDDEFSPAEDSVKSYNTVPRDKAGQKPIAWNATSPVHEVRELVREGTVGTLVKDVFKNMQLTGGCMDSSSLQRREKTPTSSGTTPSSAGFKFPIEGIDTPSAEPASFEAEPLHKDNGEENTDAGKSPASAEAVRQDLARRGFRPIIDMKMAGEIKKKAQDLTSRKPHEAVETQVAEQRQLQDTATDRESELLRQTREGLNKQVLEAGLNRTFGNHEDAGYGVVLRKTQREIREEVTGERLSYSAHSRPESTALSAISADTGRDVTMEEVGVAEEATKDQKSSLHKQLLDFHAKKAALSSGSVSEVTTSVIQVSDSEHSEHNDDSAVPDPEPNTATANSADEPATVYESSGVNHTDKRRKLTTKEKSAGTPEKVSLRAAIASTKMEYRSPTEGSDQKQQDTYEEFTIESIDETAGDAAARATQEQVPSLESANENEPTIHSHSYQIETALGDRYGNTSDRVSEQQHSNQRQAYVTTVESSEQTEAVTVNHHSSTGYDHSFRQVEVTAMDGDERNENNGLLSMVDIGDNDSNSTLSDTHSSVTVVEKQPEGWVKRTDFDYTERDSTDQAVIDTILASGVLHSNEPPQFNGAYTYSGRRLANDTHTTERNYWASSERESTLQRPDRGFSGGLIVRVLDNQPSHPVTYGGPRQWPDSPLSTPRRSTASSSEDESAAWSAVRVRYARPHTRPRAQRQQQRTRSSTVTSRGRDLAPRAVRAPLLQPLTVQVNMDGRRAGDQSSSLYMVDTPPSRHACQRRAPRGYKTVIKQSGDGGWRAAQRGFPNDYNGYYYECEHQPTGQPPATVVVANSKMRDGTRSSSTKTRYLRVEESHTGRIPVRRNSARSRPANVTQVRLDGGAYTSDLETHSAYSEPLYRWKPTSGKYSVQRAMQDRIISAPPQHPDLRYRDQTSYTLNQAESMGDLQDLGIDPELRDADKRGENYHITLKLKSTGTPSRPGSRTSRYVDETQIHDSSFGYVNDGVPYGEVIQTAPVQYLDGGGGQAVTTREERIYAVQNISPRPQYDGGYSVTRVHSDGISPPPPLVSACSSSNSSRQFEQNTSHYSVGNGGGGGGPKSNFSMQINQTMTMGYKPTDQQPPTPAQGSGPKYYVRSVTETNRQDRDRVVMNGNVRQTEDDLEQYLSPVEDYNNYGLHSAENLPQVVRGNILIKNSIDTTGAPRVVDIVEENESDEVVVEDNVNPFHGHYFQSRENPMYSSDQDLSRIHRETTTKVYDQRQPPRHLVNMFDNTKKTTTTTTKKKSRTVPRETGNDGFDREIKVTRGRSYIFVYKF